MGRRKAGGFIVEWYAGDHEPFHVHIYEGSDFIGRFDVVHQRPIGDWEMTAKIRKALKETGFIFEEAEKGGTGSKKNRP